MPIFSFVVLKDAVRILGPCASHPISALCADGDSMRATPSVSGVFFSSWPQYSGIPSLLSHV